MKPVFADTSFYLAHFGGTGDRSVHYGVFGGAAPRLTVPPDRATGGGC